MKFRLRTLFLLLTASAFLAWLVSYFVVSIDGYWNYRVWWPRRDPATTLMIDIHTPNWQKYPQLTMRWHYQNRDIYEVEIDWEDGYRTIDWEAIPEINGQKSHSFD
jgi:hypothetical protein